MNICVHVAAMELMLPSSAETCTESELSSDSPQDVAARFVVIFCSQPIVEQLKDACV